ncbi:DUF6415 family natural product biosynthesis protein [Streptomyces antibioticus]|uniref:DUF6415 family natural product biosynthesis protein n=1 Tax=Streptomyces antibioticus TaxID=1890 RepID=UPI0033BC9C42
MPEDTLLPGEALTVRRTFESVLSALRLPAGEELANLHRTLRGHVQILALKVQDQAARMHGEMRALAVHVLVSTARLLEETEDVGPSPPTPGDTVYDLAVMARALLSLHERPGPLGEATGAQEIAEEICRRVCAPDSRTASPDTAAL